MKDLNKKRTISISVLVILLNSCTSIPSEYPSSNDSTAEYPYLSARDPYTVLQEIVLTVGTMDKQMSGYDRDMDDPEWMKTYINYLAGRDLFIIEEIHLFLKYSNWDNSQKKIFIEYFFNPSYMPDQKDSLPAYLQNLRFEMLEELKYLVQYSFLLKDYPWMIRSSFDENSEFSFWYLTYIAKSIDPLWVDNTILPAMLKLIPVDEITPVSYLWLKNPGSLSSMNQEILMSGYPWTTLMHIIRIKRELFKEFESLYQNESLPGENSEGVLI
ncbi:MAG: hypothetical protein B6241_07050 [Spirochaetaceae bacterium 4572_59]|nr:MAG: hypothetical protein B6241_07050 [Spirochaetaceae bacterium 4572_59]